MSSGNENNFTSYKHTSKIKVITALVYKFQFVLYYHYVRNTLLIFIHGIELFFNLIL